MHDLERGTLISVLVEHIGIIVLIIIAVVLSIDENVYQFKWDGLSYYKAVRDASLSSISSLALYGHNAMSSGGFYRLFSSLANDTGWGMVISNRVIFALAIWAFYESLKVIVPGRENKEYIWGSLCFASSPFLLGMAGYYSTDWFSVCVSVILLYFVIKRYWIITTVFSCVFCFTKEPALIAYTGICIGVVIDTLINSKDILDCVRNLFFRARSYFLFTPYILWFATYKILGQWSAGGGGFAIDAQYIIRKLKVFYVLNFNWLIFLMILVGLIFCCKKRCIKENSWWLLPVLCSNGTLLVFNIVYKTSNHSRYIDSFISYQIFLMIVLVLIIVNKIRLRVCIFMGVSLLSIISCYVCIDPVTLVTFNKHTVGKGCLISTDELVFGDSSIYNFQMLWMEKPLSEAISDALQEGTEIVFAISDNSIYSFDGMSEMIGLPSDLYKDIQYWDYINERRVPYAYENVEDYHPFIVYHVADGVDVDRIECDNRDISVIYVKGVNNYTASDSYYVAETEIYKYRNWIINRDVLKSKTY